MAKNNLYDKIQTDLKDAIENNNEFLVINFKSMVSRIEDLRNVVGDKLTNEDVLIVLKEIYKDIQQKKLEIYSSSKYYKEIENLLIILDEYFISNGYNNGDYNLSELSNGVSIDKANREIDKMNESKKLKNTISEVLLIIGIIIIVISFILGIVLGKNTNELSLNSEFSLEVAITYWLIGGISGLIIIGFSEIIKILHDIRRETIKRKL